MVVVLDHCNLNPPADVIEHSEAQITYIAILKWETNSR